MRQKTGLIFPNLGFRLGGMNIIEKLIEDFGSQAKLAAYLGVKPQAVTNYINEGGLPATRAVQLERKSRGKYKAVKTAIPSPIAA